MWNAEQYIKDADGRTNDAVAHPSDRTKLTAAYEAITAAGKFAAITNGEMTARLLHVQHAVRAALAPQIPAMPDPVLTEDSPVPVTALPSESEQPRVAA